MRKHLWILNEKYRSKAIREIKQLTQKNYIALNVVLLIWVEWARTSYHRCSLSRKTSVRFNKAFLLSLVTQYTVDWIPISTWIVIKIVFTIKLTFMHITQDSWQCIHNSHKIPKLHFSVCLTLQLKLYSNFNNNESGMKRKSEAHREIRFSSW